MHDVNEMWYGITPTPLLRLFNVLLLLPAIRRGPLSA